MKGYDGFYTDDFNDNVRYREAAIFEDETLLLFIQKFLRNSSMLLKKWKIYIWLNLDLEIGFHYLHCSTRDRDIVYNHF